MTADNLRESAYWNRRPSASQGQFAIEYAVVVAVVVAALLSMAVYVKRALSGRWRQTGDVFGHGRQYEPGVTTISRQ